MKKRLAVIGAGSAGILSLVHFCTWLSNEWDIVSIHNPNKKILGIGESTNGGFVGLLERGCHFSLGEDLDKLDATLKFGSKFSGWRPHSWINPLLDGNIAIHFNNFKLKEFAYERLSRNWPEKFKVQEGNVEECVTEGDRVRIRIDGQDHYFDYVLDCMGFPSDLGKYRISNCTPVNRCLIHSIENYDFEPYTDHIAHKNGWMFGVPLKNRKTYGYMFNDQITTAEEARVDMMEILKVPELETKEKEQREYKFKCYYTENLIEGRVAKNGNMAIFFEPLVANSIFLYIYSARLLCDFILNGVPADQCNAMFTKAVQEMEDVITYYYQGGSTHDSPFWRHATTFARARMHTRQEFFEQMNLYREFKARGILHHAGTYGWVPLTWELIDRQMGYNYIEGEQSLAAAGR